MTLPGIRLTTNLELQTEVRELWSASLGFDAGGNGEYHKRYWAMDLINWSKPAGLNWNKCIDCGLPFIMKDAYQAFCNSHCRNEYHKFLSETR